MLCGAPSRLRYTCLSFRRSDRAACQRSPALKNRIVALLETALEAVQRELPDLAMPDSINLQRTRDSSHGDFASNVAMTLAKSARMAPPLG